jgi:uncharacterized protein (TIGR03067 family)
MHARLATAVLATLLVAADPPDDAVKKEREKLQGTWVVQSIQTSGTKKSVEGVTFSFDGDKMIVKDKSFTTEGTYTIDPTKSPKEMNWLMKAMGKGMTTTYAFYSLDGDTLKICTGPTVNTTGADGKDTGKKPLRPAKFDPSAGTVFTLTREKK